MVTVLQRRKTTTGAIYEKRRDSLGREYIVKEGDGIQAYMQGTGEGTNKVKQGGGGSVWGGVETGSKHQGDIEIATPDGKQRVEWHTASKAGRAANHKENNVNADATININGKEYTAEELEQAYTQAGSDTPDLGAVRYL